MHKVKTAQKFDSKIIKQTEPQQKYRLGTIVVVSARVLKECSSKIAPVLTYIFNESLAQGAVPDDWRQANVAPVFKKGEKYDAANYRPVSLTCICCKTLEHIIVSNINKHLALENILADCQHGFRSQRSCETQ